MNADQSSRRNSARKGALIRWEHQLDPQLTSVDWTPSECMRLLHTYRTVGPSWKQISQHFGNRGARGVKNQFFSMLRSYIQRLFKSGCPGFAPNEVHRVKPKVLANFLDYVFDTRDSVHKIDQPRCSVFDLIEQMNTQEESSKSGETLHLNRNLNYEKGLADLRMRK